MQEEIKEILESLDKISKAEYYPEDLLTYKECQLLLDYITNLQEENEILEEKLNQANKFANGRIKDMLDYKSRNEKAIEYINDNSHYYSTDTNKEGFVIDNEDEVFCNDLLNLLQGVDKE